MAAILPPETPPAGDPPPSSADPLARHRKRRRRSRAALLSAVALACLAGVFHRPLFLGNFGVVDPGRVYRCAQPKANLEELIANYRPASILNLRGGSRRDWWYAAEVDVTHRNHIHFYDFPLSAEKRPTRRQLLTLLDFLDRAEYPLVIHCKKGADRTGLVSALYLMSHKSVPPRQARESLSIWHGHIPIAGTARLHEPLLEYDAWLSSSRLDHSPQRFRAWVEQHYHDPADPAPSRFFIPLPEGPRWDYLERITHSTAPTQAAGTKPLAPSQLR